jgi:beta-galactosidase
MHSVAKKTAYILLLLLSIPFCFYGQEVKGSASISLNGKWEIGFARNYTANTIVPGIAEDPAKANDQKLWYKKQVQLPTGNWEFATLELKGARFMPQVYVNGELIGKLNGGMAPVFILLKHAGVKPGNTITIEIALESLKNMPVTDASYIPVADQWRSNISSCLWDDVILYLHGTARISTIVPFIHFKDHKADIKFKLDAIGSFTGNSTLQIIDKFGKVIITTRNPVLSNDNVISFDYANKLKAWSPQRPNLYHLKLTIANSKGDISDQAIIPFGVKEYHVENKYFYLNGERFTARGGTVVWHRWMRSKDGVELGYDTAWFKQNVIKRLKDHGANYIRFHLGKPPERFLDLCDQYGLIVQYEWSFFHGVTASKESLLEQYKSWLDVAMRHPSVSMIHPYNETKDEQLKPVWAALNELLPNYPQLVLEDRDVLHIHKYWWGLFENLGLYYDDANQFPKALMADEFGGNYLDENGDLGNYPALKESFLRFLGRNHTKEMRLKFHAQSNSQIAEYWRRIGAAGFAPFCILGSKEDGSSWFLGPLKEGNPKPVWDALTAAFASKSVSIELWDKSFTPGQVINLPVYLFNDDAQNASMVVKLNMEDKTGHTAFSKTVTAQVNKFSKKIETVTVKMPAKVGDYIIKAELINKAQSVKYPVVSQWDIRVYQANIPANVKLLKIGIPSDEKELKSFIEDHHIKVVDISDTSADLLITSISTWNNIAKGDLDILALLEKAIEKGKSVVMLDVGERSFGQGYPVKGGDLGSLHGLDKITNPVIKSYPLFGGLKLKFTQTAEPESFIHPDKNNRMLWAGMPNEYTGIWNGLRGGLIVPATNMEFTGLSQNAFITQWISRGANEEKIMTGPYYAYELQGFYKFSNIANDSNTQKDLKAKVQQMVQDAPSLANSINPFTPVTMTNLTESYQDAKNRIADNFTPLANCGKNLTQTPVAVIEFGKRKGTLLISQLLTTGRLAHGFGQPGLYGIRYDEVAVQYVLNMISVAKSAAQKKN